VVPYHDDMRHLFELLELKTATFYCQTMPAAQLDEPAFRTDLSAERDKANKERRADMEQHPVREEYADIMRETARAQPDLAPVAERGRFTVNRDFWIFCASYWYPIKRALYLIDMFPRMQLERMDRVETYLPDGAVARMEAWCRRMAAQQGDNFQDRLEEAADEGIVFLPLLP
jgi:hypothetical protein